MTYWNVLMNDVVAHAPDLARICDCDGADMGFKEIESQKCVGIVG